METFGRLQVKKTFLEFRTVSKRSLVNYANLNSVGSNIGTMKNYIPNTESDGIPVDPPKHWPRQVQRILIEPAKEKGKLTNLILYREA